jgi:Fe-S-cluster containining protein
MNCKNCNLKSKIVCCCGEHPETRETKNLIIKGEVLKACPNLTKEGLCLIYDSRPEICKEFIECSIN